MFDEVDESTALFKLAPSPRHAPVTPATVTLDADGVEVPSDGTTPRPRRAMAAAASAMIDPIPLDAHAAGRPAACCDGRLSRLRLRRRQPHGVAHAPESARRDRRRGDGRPHQPHHERARARARSALSPDGRTLALAAGPTRIFLRQLASGQLTNLTEAGLEGASAGRSGRRRLADRLPGRRATARRRQAQGSSRLVVPARGGMPRPVFESTPPPFAFAPAWFPNQKDLVFSGGNGIFAVAAAGNEMPRRLVPGSDVHSPRWSPDGRWLAYVEHGTQFTFGEQLFGTVTDSRLVVHPNGSAATIAVTDGNATTRSGCPTA